MKFVDDLLIGNAGLLVEWKKLSDQILFPTESGEAKKTGKLVH